jgi:hypothetical protein
MLKTSLNIDGLKMEIHLSLATDAVAKKLMLIY